MKKPELVGVAPTVVTPPECDLTEEWAGLRDKLAFLTRRKKFWTHLPCSDADYCYLSITELAS